MNKLKKYIPNSVKRVIMPFYIQIKLFIFRLFGRKKTFGETFKASERRLREDFFEKFCHGRGLDIGYGGDLLTPNCQGYDFEHGDATKITKYMPEYFDFVYSSHTLEHLSQPGIALQNWWSLVKPAGYLLLYVPHRDLYEKKMELPSRWNPDHKHYFLLENDDPPHTIGILSLIRKNLNNYQVVYARVCSDKHTIDDPLIHSDGEYSIELVLKKIP